MATTIAFSGLGAVAIQAVQSVVSAPAAHADDPGTRLHGVIIQAPPPGAFGDWGMWLGSLANPNGPGNGFCFEMGEDAGFVPGVEGALNIAWLNKAIIDNQADVSTHPALAYLVHEAADPRFNNPWNGQGEPYPDLKNSTDPQLVAIRAQAEQIKAAAQSTAGPYSGTAALAMSDNVHGTVSSVAVLSAAGNQVTGLPLTATLTNAVWDGFGSSTVTIQSGESLPAFTAVATGPVNVLLEGTGPASTVTTFTVEGKQDILTGGATAPFSFRSADVQATVAFQPVATSTAPVYLESGQKLTDVLHVKTSTGNPNDWVFANGANVPAVFDVDWYYSPVELPASPQIPAEAVKVASGTVTATGPGDVTATADTAADKAGYFYPVARFSKNTQPANLQQYFIGDWQAGFNDPGEQSIVKYQPEVITKASVIENGKVHDVLEVTGNQPGKELTVTTDLILTSEKSVEGGTDQAPADAVKVGTVTTKVIGNGTFTTPAVDVPWETIITKKWDAGQSANLYFSEKILATDNTKEWDGKELLPKETIPLEKPKVTTQASENGTVPVTSTDKAKVTGDVPSGENVSTSLAWKLYKFGDDTTSSVQAVCQKDFWASSASVDVPKAGDYVSEPVTISDKGTYGYIETLTVKYTDAKGNIKTSVLHEGKCGEKLETVIAFPKDVPPSPEKPVLNVPMVPAGEAVTQAEVNTPLIFGGAAVLVAMLAIGGGVYVQRRKAATMGAADNTEHPEDLS